jgi:uncharacterized membrane protein
VAPSYSDRPAGAAGREKKRVIWSGLLAGVGLAAFIDETVFHQLLHWHHFYDKSTLAAGLVSDGFFHAFGFTAMVVGVVLAGRLAAPGRLHPETMVGRAAAGGGFQLYDGIVQHKILKLHQIRYHVTLWPYDLTWNGIAVIMIIAGILLMQGRAGVATSGIFRTGHEPSR